MSRCVVGNTMKRGRSTGKPTKAQQSRFEAIKTLGCIACRLAGIGNVPCDVHHMTVGGKHGQKRLGHDYTFGLCKWHHVGERIDFVETIGPSFAKEPRKFREHFGSQDELLGKQNEVLSKYWRNVATADALMGVYGYRRVE